MRCDIAVCGGWRERSRGRATSARPPPRHTKNGPNRKATWPGARRPMATAAPGPWLYTSRAAGCWDATASCATTTASLRLAGVCRRIPAYVDTPRRIGPWAAVAPVCCWSAAMQLSTLQSASQGHRHTHTHTGPLALSELCEGRLQASRRRAWPLHLLALPSAAASLGQATVGRIGGSGSGIKIETPAEPPRASRFRCGMSVHNHLAHEPGDACLQPSESTRTSNENDLCPRPIARRALTPEMLDEHKSSSSTLDSRVAAACCACASIPRMRTMRVASCAPHPGIAVLPQRWGAISSHSEPGTRNLAPSSQSQETTQHRVTTTHHVTRHGTPRTKHNSHHATPQHSTLINMQ